MARRSPPALSRWVAKEWHSAWGVAVAGRPSWWRRRSTNFWTTRGFHWYAFDLASEDFIDVSADEPDGVGALRLQVVTITADPVNGRIYGITIPENQLLY